MESLYTVQVNDIEFDLETDDPWELTMDISKEQYRENLGKEWASGRIYTVMANDQDEAMNLVMDEITDDSGWFITSIDCDFVETN